MDGVNAMAGADVHRLMEGPWMGAGRDEDPFGQQFGCEDQGCSIYADPAFETGAAGLGQLAEGESASPKWRVSAMPCAAAGHLLAGAGADSLAAVPREMTCDFRDDSLGAPPAAESAVQPHVDFHVGEKVAYWSETHTTWMQAIVQRPNKVDGTLVSYDLDVKKGAHVAKIQRLAQTESWEQPLTPPGVRASGKPTTSCALMREVPTPTPLANAAMGNGLTASGAPAPEKAPAAISYLGNSVHVGAQGLSLPSEDIDVAPRYEVGDKVDYWSETYGQWMSAVVREVRQNGAVYDLDVKRGAQPRRMRHADQGDSGLTPSTAAATALAAAAQTAGPPAHTAQPSAVEGAAVAPPRGTAFLRGPSPLSGRARAGNVSMPLDAASPPGEADQEDWAPLRPAPDVMSRPVSSMGGITPPCAAKVKGGLSLPVHNGNGSDVVQAGGGRGKSTNVTHCSMGSSATAISPQLAQSVGCRASTAGGPPGSITSVGGQAEAPTPPSGAVTTPSGFAGGGTPPSAGAPAARPTVHAAERPPARSEAGGARTSGPLFMGTGMEGRRREPGASPAHGGRAGAAATAVAATAAGTGVGAGAGTGGPRASLAGATAPCRRDGASSAACTGASSPACSSTSAGRGLEVGELDIGSGPFDPTHQSVRSQLITKLNLGGHTTIEEMQGFRGGLNEGVWFLNDPAQGSAKNGGKEELVMKLVKCQRVAQGIPTEAENCLKIFREHPGVINDPAVAFPFKIFSCLGASGTKRYDLIVMRKVRGERLAELIARKWYSKQVPQLMQILEKLGVCLAEFHSRYGSSQHGDFQPSNIFCDEEREEIALIDVGGMGVPTMESDVEHFSKSMKLLAEAYGSQLSTDGMRHFERGYAKVAGKG